MHFSRQSRSRTQVAKCGPRGVQRRKMADGDAASAQSRRRGADGTGAGRGPPEIITNVIRNNRRAPRLPHSACDAGSRRGSREPARPRAQRQHTLYGLLHFPGHTRHRRLRGIPESSKPHSTPKSATIYDARRKHAERKSLVCSDKNLSAPSKATACAPAHAAARPASRHIAVHCAFP